METGLDIEDKAALLAYLRVAGRIGPDENPTIEVLPGGVSCRTVRVERPDGESWVLKQALPRLRVEVEWLSDPRRIHREALGMQWLERLAPEGSIPRFAFEDERHHLLAMEAVAQPHRQWKALLLDGLLEEDHVIRFGVLLADIHRNALQIQELADVFDDRSFFESLRVEPYYQYSATRVPQAAAFLHDLVSRTRARRTTLVHGDYSPKNVLVREGRLVLLDHEVIHWGDGAFDVGFATTHFLAKSLHVTGRRPAFLEAARLFWNTYRSRIVGPLASGEYEARAVRHTLGCVLARAVGRSKLEYLSADERRIQAGAAVALMEDPPATMERAVAGFGDVVGAESPP